MSQDQTLYPPDLRYTREHEWLQIREAIGTIGITHYAQSELGDIVYTELPAVGTAIVAGEEFGTVESVKAVSELYAPASGEVVEVNPSLAESPEAINRDPYGAGWLIRIRMANPDDAGELLSAGDYRKLVEDESD